MIKPSREVDYREAEARLRAWLIARGRFPVLCREWNRWTYNDRPFWSTWSVFTTEGFQIYDDGEILEFARG
jgi:hypothetical protein